MALRDGIRVLSEQWVEVLSRLAPDSGRLVTEAVRSVTQYPDDEGLMLDVVSHLYQMLPHDHAIFAAVAVEEVRSATTAEVWEQVIDRLRQLVAEGVR